MDLSAGMYMVAVHVLACVDGVLRPLSCAPQSGMLSETPKAYNLTSTRPLSWAPRDISISYLCQKCNRAFLG